MESDLFNSDLCHFHICNAYRNSCDFDIQSCMTVQDMIYMNDESELSAKAHSVHYVSLMEILKYGT